MYRRRAGQKAGWVEKKLSIGWRGDTDLTASPPRKSCNLGDYNYYDQKYSEKFKSSLQISEKEDDDKKVMQYDISDINIEDVLLKVK